MGAAIWSDNGNAWIILGMGSASERRRYYVTPSLIGRAHTQNDPFHVKKGIPTPLSAYKASMTHPIACIFLTKHWSHDAILRQDQNC